MGNTKKEPWVQLGKHRIISILGRHVVACGSTLEQKISGAGPYGQRVQPHILGPALNELVKKGEVKFRKCGANNTKWYYLPDAENVQDRLNEQLPIHNRFNKGNINKRIGQCLEISIFKSLLAQTSKKNSLNFLGHIHLDKLDENFLYGQEPPPSSFNGKTIDSKKLDFIIEDRKNGIYGGIEAKNARQWLYPYHKEVLELLDKALTLDCVPILVARKFSPITVSILTACGVVLHETYYQLLSKFDSELAEKARDKNLLGYHDIRIGDEPDQRMKQFIEINLPKVLPVARTKFDKHKNLIRNYLDQIAEAEKLKDKVLRDSAFENFARAFVDIDDYHGPNIL